MFPKKKTVTRVLMLNPEGDKIAVLLRRYPADHPNWANETFALLPGGKVDAGETSEAAARRECLEEVGIDPGRLGYFGYRYEPGENITTHFFLALPKSDSLPDGYEGEPHITDAEQEKFVGDVHWVAPDDFLDFCNRVKATPGRLIAQAVLRLGRQLQLMKH